MPSERVNVKTAEVTAKAQAALRNLVFGAAKLIQDKPDLTAWSMVTIEDVADDLARASALLVRLHSHRQMDLEDIAAGIMP